MRCAAALNAPTADSAIVEEDAIFLPFDTTRKLPDSYRDQLGQGMRQMLVLPRPLVIGTYDDRAGYAKSDAGSKQYAAVARPLDAARARLFLVRRQSRQATAPHL